MAKILYFKLNEVISRALDCAVLTASPNKLVSAVAGEGAFVQLFNTKLLQLSR